MRLALPTLAILATASVASAGWQAEENITSYAITGSRAPELYASIGSRGPLIEGSRVIALTTFKLTWTRDYQMRGRDCVLDTAKPRLVITYLLPKPARRLPPATRPLWQSFIAGVERHERVHGDHIKTMVKDIEKATIGLTAENDPGCRKIRQKMTPLLKALSDEQRRRSSEFDRVEMSPGGKVHQLILDLVNGGR